MQNPNDNPIAIIMGTVFSIAFVSAAFKAILLSCISAIVGVLVTVYFQRWLNEKIEEKKKNKEKEDLNDFKPIKEEQ